MNKSFKKLNKVLNDHAYKSIRWKLLSCVAFAIINGLVRLLNGGASSEGPSFNQGLHSYEIIFFQHLFGSLFLLPIFFRTKNQFGFLAMRKQPLLFVLRIAGAVLGLGCWYAALYHMPIAQVMLLSFLGPIVSTVGGSIILGERMSRHKYSAILLGLLGSILIGQPNILEEVTRMKISWAMFLPISATILFSAVTLITRHLGKSGENPTVLAGQLLFFIIPPAFLASLNHWVTPNLSQLGVMVLLGGTTAFAHVCFCKAYTTGEVTSLIPFGVFKFVLSVAIGYAAFGEFPSGLAVWTGISAILSGMLIMSSMTRKGSPQIQG